MHYLYLVCVNVIKLIENETIFKIKLIFCSVILWVEFTFEISQFLTDQELNL